METKGLRRPGFDIRWKLFKRFMEEKEFLLLMPSNKKEVLACIEIIKQHGKGRRE
jgi:hypothetical protein